LCYPGESGERCQNSNEWTDVLYICTKLVYAGSVVIVGQMLPTMKEALELLHKAAKKNGT
jgi:hypothetical protein